MHFIFPKFRCFMYLTCHVCLTVCSEGNCTDKIACHSHIDMQTLHFNSIYFCTLMFTDTFYLSVLPYLEFFIQNLPNSALYCKFHIYNWILLFHLHLRNSQGLISFNGHYNSFLIYCFRQALTNVLYMLIPFILISLLVHPYVNETLILSENHIPKLCFISDNSCWCSHCSFSISIRNRLICNGAKMAVLFIFSSC